VKIALALFFLRAYGESASRCMARASPVFAGTPAPTGITLSIFVLSTTVASAGRLAPLPEVSLEDWVIREESPR
jgi:hypothetical protein